MQKNRRAQQGGSAATVIGIMALLFVFYILFLPPEERADLLYGTTNEDGTISTSKIARTLLLADIGRLDYIADTSYDHTMPNVLLAQTRNAQTLATFSPFRLKRSWFEQKDKTVTFSIQDPDKTDNVLLTFEAPTRTGVLTITLNDEVIYEAPIDSQTPPPIPLRRAQLGTHNTLTFSLSNTGAAFWKVNEMQMNNVQVIGDVSDSRFQMSTSVFTLLDEEARNIKKATLYFYPICDRKAVGLMDASINDDTVLNARPDCESINKIEVDTKKLHAGANTLEMRASQGTIRVEQLRVRTELEKTKSYIDYFQLNATDMDRIHDDNRKVRLKINFVLDNEDKIGTVNVNGKLSTFNQRNATYTKDITSFLQEGNNYIELRPESILNIVKLEVRLE